MRVQRLISYSVLLGTTILAFGSAPAADPNTMELVTKFTVTAATQVPGKTLKAGDYSIRVIDHLSDRVILQIEDAKGSSQTRFLALESAELRGGAKRAGPLTWLNGTSTKVDTLRGFAFPGGATVEFVYPKKDAVLIAKVNSSKVPAIDPESEGRVTARDLSTDDLQTVNLWTLLATRVGPADAQVPAIEAERYHAPTPPASSDQTRVEARRANVPAKFASTPHMQASPVNQQTSELHKPLLKTLPHTASLQPLFALLGLIALLMARLTHLLRRTSHELHS